MLMSMTYVSGPYSPSGGVCNVVYGFVAGTSAVSTINMGTAGLTFYNDPVYSMGWYRKSNTKIYTVTSNNVLTFGLMIQSINGATNVVNNDMSNVVCTRIA